jgi:hypothetical protein
MKSFQIFSDSIPEFDLLSVAVQSAGKLTSFE